MTRIIFCGWNGRMGKNIAELVEADPDAQIVAGIDLVEGKADFPTYTWDDKLSEEADVIIDFSSPKALKDVLPLALERKIPVVFCTTGYSEEQLAQIKEASKQIAVLKSGNMSLGINTMMKLVKAAAEILANNGFDIEIVEKHHNQKLDAPSGTALMLADAANSGCGNKCEYVYGRSDRREKRPQNEIGISSVRGGSIVGEHEVILAGLDEVVEIKHTAYSRAIFGKGAIAAAKFLATQPAGMYDMSNVIG